MPGLAFSPDMGYMPPPQFRPTLEVEMDLYIRQIRCHFGPPGGVPPLGPQMGVKTPWIAP